MRWAEGHRAVQGRIFSSSFSPTNSSSSSNQQMLNLDDPASIQPIWSNPISPSCHCTDDEMMWGSIHREVRSSMYRFWCHNKSGQQCFSQASSRWTRVGTKSVFVPHVLDIQVIPHQYWLSVPILWFRKVSCVLLPDVPLWKGTIAIKESKYMQIHVYIALVFNKGKPALAIGYYSNKCWLFFFSSGHCPNCPLNCSSTNSILAAKWVVPCPITDVIL